MNDNIIKTSKYLTEDEKKERLRISHKKYYEKNKEKIISFYCEHHVINHYKILSPEDREKVLTKIEKLESRLAIYKKLYENICIQDNHPHIVLKIN